LKRRNGDVRIERGRVYTGYRKRKPQFKSLSTQLTPAIERRIWSKKANEMECDINSKPHQLISIEQI